MDNIHILPQQSLATEEEEEGGNVRQNSVL